MRLAKCEAEPDAVHHELLQVRHDMQQLRPHWHLVPVQGNPDLFDKLQLPESHHVNHPELLRVPERYHQLCGVRAPEWVYLSMQNNVFSEI
jgi:hypothetical protein